MQGPASDLHQQLFGRESPPSPLPRRRQLHSHPINTDNASVAPRDLNSSSGRNVAGDQEKVTGPGRTEQTHGGVRTGLIQMLSNQIIKTGLLKAKPFKSCLCL